MAGYVLQALLRDLTSFLGQVCLGGHDGVDDVWAICVGLCLFMKIREVAKAFFIVQAAAKDDDISIPVITIRNTSEAFPASSVL